MENSFSRKRSQGAATAPTAHAAAINLTSERLLETIHGPRSNKASYEVELFHNEEDAAELAVDDAEAEIAADEVSAAAAAAEVAPIQQQAAARAAARALHLDPAGLNFTLPANVEDEQEWGDPVPDEDPEFVNAPEPEPEPGPEPAPLRAEHLHLHLASQQA